MDGIGTDASRVTGGVRALLHPAPRAASVLARRPEAGGSRGRDAR